MLKKIIILFFVFNLFSRIALAQDIRSDSVAEIQFVDTTPQMAEDLEKQLIAASHEVIEGAEQKRFLDNWKQNFNFYQKLKDGYRWSSMNEGTTGRDIILDSVLLFSISHSIEMSSGPVLVAVGASHGWPEWVLSMVGVAGGVVSVPGLDPLCMVVFASYSKSKTVRKVIRHMRVALVRSSQFASDKTGLTWFLKKHIQKASIADKLSSLEFLDKIEIFENKTEFVYKFIARRELVASATIQLSEGKTAFLKSAFFEHLHDVNPKEIERVRDFVNQFPWNISQALKEVSAAATKNKEFTERVYTPRVEQEERGKILVEFADNAVKSSGGYQLVKKSRCVDVFAL